MIDDPQRQFVAVRDDQLAALPHDVECMNAVRRTGIVNAGDRDGLVRQLRFGMNLDRQFVGDGGEQSDGDDLPAVVVGRLPLLNPRRRGDVENALALGDGDSHLIEFAAEDAVLQRRIGVNQPVGNADTLQVGDAGQQFHLRLSTGAGVPAGNNSSRRAEIRFDVRDALLALDGRLNESGTDLHLLIGLRDDEVQRRDGDRRRVEGDLSSVGRGVDPRGEFERHLLLALILEQQNVGALARAAQQHFARAAGDVTDGGVTEVEGDFDPRFADDTNRQLGRDAGDVFLNAGGIVGPSDDGFDFGAGGTDRACRLRPQLEVVGIRDDDRRVLLIQHVLQLLVRDVDDPLGGRFCRLGVVRRCGVLRFELSGPGRQQDEADDE